MSMGMFAAIYCDWLCGIHDRHNLNSIQDDARFAETPACNRKPCHVIMLSIHGSFMETVINGSQYLGQYQVPLLINDVLLLLVLVRSIRRWEGILHDYLCL